MREKRNCVGCSGFVRELVGKGGVPNAAVVFGDSDGIREREMEQRQDDKRTEWRDSEKAVRNASAESTLWSASVRPCYFF